MPIVETAASSSSSSSTSEMRRRRVATSTVDGEVTQTSTGNEKPTGGAAAEPIPVTLASGWRCAQATMIVFVILNVVLALWIVVEMTSLRHDVSELIANGTTVETAWRQDGVAPRVDTMARMAEAATDAFRKRNNP